MGEEAERGDAKAQEKLSELEPPVLVNVAKQRNGDWEGKFGLWFSLETYQYRSAHDDRHGHRFVVPPGEPQAANVEGNSKEEAAQ